MRVFVMGIDHEIQKCDAWRPEEMKVAYRAILTSTITQYGVQFVGEESHPDYQTVGHSLGVELGLLLPWRNIDMPEQARKDAGIYQEQLNRIPVPQLGTVKTHLAADGFHLDLKNGWHSFSPRVPSDSVREDWMFERAVEGAGHADSILILCGNLHVEELARRFRAAGHTVCTDALHNYDWYDTE